MENKHEQAISSLKCLPRIESQVAQQPLSSIPGYHLKVLELKAKISIHRKATPLEQRPNRADNTLKAQTIKKHGEANRDINGRAAFTYK